MASTCAHARLLQRLFASLPALPRAAAAAPAPRLSLYPAGATVPASFPALPPKKAPKPRKAPSKMQRPPLPLVRGAPCKAPRRPAPPSHPSPPPLTATTSPLARAALASPSRSRR